MVEQRRRVVERHARAKSALEPVAAENIADAADLKRRDPDVGDGVIELRVLNPPIDRVPAEVLRALDERAFAHVVKTIVPPISGRDRLEVAAFGARPRRRRRRALDIAWLELLG